MYPPELTEPMRQELIAAMADLNELTAVGARWRTGTALIFVNSVCGCAAAMQAGVDRRFRTRWCQADRVGTVFAGVDRCHRSGAHTWPVFHHQAHQPPY